MSGPWKIPATWQWSTMGEVAEVVGGGTPRTSRAEYYGGDIPWITPADLSGYSEKRISRGARSITRVGLENSGARLMPAGTVLFSSRAPIGYVAIAANPVSTNQGFKSFVLRDGLTPDYVYYHLQHAKSLAVELASGTTFLEISGKKAAQIPIPVAPVDEQRRIVEEIEKQFTRLEAGVAALRQVQVNLKRYRAAVLKAACEGKLVPTQTEIQRAESRGQKDFETGEQLLQRILTERRDWFDRQQASARIKKKYVEPPCPETENLPSLPKGWVWGTWNQLSNWVTYGFTRPMPHVDEGISIITAKGVNRGRIDFEGADLTTKEAYVELSEKDRPQPGDILITKDGTIGRAAVVDTEREFCINQSVAVIWLRSCPMERKFLLTVIESELTQKPIWAKARGVAIQHLSITDFAKMALPIPPLAEQTRIVAEAERRLSVVEELEMVVFANLQCATRLRQSILQRVFSGNL